MRDRRNDHRVRGRAADDRPAGHERGPRGDHPAEPGGDRGTAVRLRSDTSAGQRSVRRIEPRPVQEAKPAEEAEENAQQIPRRDRTVPRRRTRDQDEEMGTETSPNKNFRG